jgi:hypothetical protein
MNGDVLDTLQYSCDPSTLAEVYEPSSGTFHATANMNKRSGPGAAILLPDGTVFITGAYVQPDGGAEIYDPIKGAFLTSTALVTERQAGHTATLLPNGSVLLAGGWICCGITLDTAEIYHPAVLTPTLRLLSPAQDGSSQGAILRAGTSTIVSADNPAAVGDVLEVYFTGLTDGSVIPPQVALGGRMAEVLWFGKAPGFGFPTLNQVNVRVPAGVVPGPAVPVRLTYLARPSNEVTIGVR